MENVFANKQRLYNRQRRAIAILHWLIMLGVVAGIAYVVICAGGEFGGWKAIVRNRHLRDGVLLACMLPVMFGFAALVVVDKWWGKRHAAYFAEWMAEHKRRTTAYVEALERAATLTQEEIDRRKADFYLLVWNPPRGKA